MRHTASLAIVLMLSAVSPASAGKCYVDSDCPTGMVCNDNGGCEVPASSGGTSTPSHTSGTRSMIYAVILGVVILALLIPAIQSSQQAGGGVRKLDDAYPPLDRGRCEPAGPVLLRF